MPTLNDPELRQLILARLAAHRRSNPQATGLFVADLEREIGQPTAYAIWFLRGLGWLETGDQARAAITAHGVEAFEAAQERHARLRHGVALLSSLASGGAQ
jgi:hypothetical protein